MRGGNERDAGGLVLDLRVRHTMDVLSPFIPVLCHSDMALLIALSLSPGNSLVSSWCDYSMLASLL